MALRIGLSAASAAEVRAVEVTGRAEAVRKDGSETTMKGLSANERVNSAAGKEAASAAGTGASTIGITLAECDFSSADKIII